MATYSTVLPTILLICTHLFPHVTASPSELLSRKNTILDPYMVCEDPPPLTSLPTNYLRAWYPTTLDLCSALNGAARNVGCVCHTSASFIHCDQAIADPVLWNTRVASTSFVHAPFQALHSWCEVSCWCVNANAARRARNRSRPRSSSAATTTTTTTARSASVDAQVTNHVQGVINVPYDPEGPNPFRDFAGSPYSIEVDATGNALGTGRNWWANQCGSNCSSNADCAAGGGNCTCLAAQKGTYQPGVGTVAFVAACIVSLAAGSASGGGGAVGGGRGGGGGKRDVRGLEEGVWGCPCNASYVSRSCCDVRDGLVWEGPDFKLGELVK